MDQLINNRNPNDNFTVTEDEQVSSVDELPETARIMMGLPSSDNGDHFRYMRIHRYGANFAVGRLPDMNSYQMTIGDGFIGCHLIHRRNGPHCNEIIRAFYQQDYAIDTLENIAFMGVVNAETAPLVMNVHYPSRGIEFATVEADENPQVWSHGTPEYQEILGTAIGKTVAYFVLSCFQRGTRPISRILTWSEDNSLCMVFEIGRTG
ncbi:uncharacterized protein N7515_006110 [Penicillium bovifimosum]|uniref:Uncharacterized protein n=1 Tax=Penicillium bovifimosum TaxID=126998 RepID=A0A9W9L0G0_9EURO|nr:uncharacterized protein N7515_006110 [Penicillium bovifimosum]KAJ5130071.1 hypothetical protein N7515_006110 [Penicillium bovifimosum]